MILCNQEVVIIKTLNRIGEDMKQLVVTYEDGKKYTYHGTFTDLLTMRMRIKENEERRLKLGMTVNKAVNFKMTEVI